MTKWGVLIASVHAQRLRNLTIVTADATRIAIVTTLVMITTRSLVKGWLGVKAADESRFIAILLSIHLLGHGLLHLLLNFVKHQSQIV